MGRGIGKIQFPTAQGKQGIWPCQGKHREFGNFAKTQGIWCAQVLHSLIVKIKVYMIHCICLEISHVSFAYENPQITNCHREFENKDLSGDPDW